MFKVYTETKEQEKDVYFKLLQDAGEVRLIACNAIGERVEAGTILTINSSGTLLLHKGVNNSLGLKIGSDGCIVVSKAY